MSNVSYPSSSPMYEWNNNRDGTYRTYDKSYCPISKPIPQHAHLNEIYNYVFNYACDGYTWANRTYEKCMEEVREKFGEISDELEEYLFRCPWDAGNRCGLLIEEPDHYD